MRRLKLLSTPDLTDIPVSFKAYFGRAVDIIITGHFYSAVITPVAVLANTTAEQTFTVKGLKSTDLVIVNKPTTTAGIIIGNCRVTADDTLGIEFGNLTGGALTPASETYLIVAIRREKE